MKLTCQQCGCEFESKRRSRLYCSRRCSNLATALDREAKKRAVKHVVLWSCGGGADSTAIAAMICAGELPRPDLAVMVDSGWDRPSTWEFVNSVIVPRLAEAGVRLDVIRTTQYMDNAIVGTNGRVKIPAHRLKPDGSVSKLHTRCNTWKSRAVRRWLRDQGVTSCEDWVGIAANEARRARPSPHKWIRYRYPLIERGYTREHCFWLCGKYGWPIPHQTSCVMCPQQTDREWMLLKTEHPGEFERACQIEDEMRKIVPDVYLYRKCLCLRDVEFGH